MSRVPLVIAIVLAGCGAKTPLRAPRDRMDAASALDAAVDAGPDACCADGGGLDDAGRDGGLDAGIDAGIDAGRDASVDAGTDAGIDAGRDGGTDAGRDDVGCADGEREGFRVLSRYPDIAGCAGGWDHPGIANPAPPACARGGGDDGPRPSGVGCGVADLCAVGWHVCLDPAEVRRRSLDGCAGAHDGAAFFATRMSGPGCGVCATGTATDCSALDCRTDCAQTSRTTNDVFGCGTLGDPPDPGTCGPLDAFSNDLCGALPAPWSCEGDASGTHEAELLLKTGPERGGVLCCRD